MDTIQINHGQHECMLSETGEAGLQEHFKHCTKDPTHAHFIPVNTFNIDHLPEDHRDIDLYELIKLTADLTVRIRVDTVSPRRLEFWPNTNTPYPFYNILRSGRMRTGSGEMRVNMYRDGIGFNGRKEDCDFYGRKFISEYETCPCEDCEYSDKPSNVWWEISVNTAAHVVFDDIEASHTTCRLFFDSSNCPRVLLHKAKVAYVNDEEDRCVLKFHTCNELGEKLYEIHRRCVALWLKVLRKYMKKGDNRLNFIVSHPHGCSKQVSIGQWIAMEKVREYDERIDMTKMTYTTSTCPGSSGAMVHCLGFGGGNHVHGGALDSWHNYSSVGGYCK